MIVLLHDFSGFPSRYSKLKLYFDDIDDIADLLLENTRCTRSTDPPVFCPEASESQQIFYGSIERFELSKSTVNLLLLAADASSQFNATQEIIGGPFDDYIVNAFFRIPLMAQLGAGANRIYSGNASDSYSLILDEHKDIIYDTGGHKLVAVMLPEGVSFNDVYIGNKSPDGDSFFIYNGVKKEYFPRVTKKIRFQIRFREIQYYQNSFRFLFKESTGKEIVFKELERPSYLPWKTSYRGWTPSVESFSRAFNNEDYLTRKYFVESVTPAKTK